MKEKSENGGHKGPLRRSRHATILRAATELFSSQGYHATTMKKIANRAGVAEGTVFNHFSGKQDVLIAVITQLYDAMTEAVHKGLRNIMDTRERLRFIATNHLEHISRDNALLIMMIHIHHGVDVHQEYLLEESAMNQLNRRYTAYFDMTVKEAIAREELVPDLDLAVCRDFFYGGLEYGQRTLFLRGRKESVADYAKTAADQFLDGVMVSAPAKQGGQEDVLARLEAVTRTLEQVSGTRRGD